MKCVHWCGVGGLSLALLLGCASTPPSSFFVLTPIPEATARGGDISGGDVSLGLGPVVFPRFLDRPQLVTRGGSNRLDVDEFNRWGGTVQDDFLRVWSENLAYLLGTSRIYVYPTETRVPLDFRITAEVVSFEGVPGGDAVLKVRWALQDTHLEHSFAVHEDFYRCPLKIAAPAASGKTLSGKADQQAAAAAQSEAVVAAMSRCLGDFSRDVAQVIRTIPPPQPPAATVSPISS
ncbi:MAG: PqiC family protein [Thiocapsa sp.]|nr:PqiC family protein [Thiocapsa sp.]MCG6896462.1 PqiC family protein [Thiocapsa sp.]